MQKAMSFNNVPIFFVKESAYRIHFWYMSKDNAIKIMNGSNLADKRDVLQNIFLLYVKMTEYDDLTYYQRNRDEILNRAKDYYESDKERLKKQARDKCRNLSEEEKNKKREYGRNRYRNKSVEKKQILKDYQKDYRGAKKPQYNNTE